MQRQVVRLTRQELYDKMWSRPAISLAEEFGISGRGLGKICSRFEIPVPVPAENSESSEKSRVLGRAAVVSAACIS